MKIKLAKYVSQFLVDNGINTMFTVTGGGAMHLNDAFGHQEGLKCYYNHHEQACTTAAEGFYRVNSKMAASCVTTGPGGTNAITGVMGAYLDSIPMIVISGQVKYSNTVKYTGLDIRQYGDQEFDIVRLTKYITKYSEMIIEPNSIRYHLEKALYLAKIGRPGPVWLDIPLNVQASIIDTDDLYGFDPKEIKSNELIKNEYFDTIIEKIKSAKRPVIYVGSAVRFSGGLNVFKKLIKKLNVPVVCACNAIDAMETKDELYVGRGGSIGDRAGNFAVQNSDFILSLGCRLNLRQVGFNFETWAREAFVAMVDVDPNEMEKPSLHVDLKICAEVKNFMTKFNNYLTSDKLFDKQDWLNKCQEWKNKYPVVDQNKKDLNQKEINPYNLIELFTKNLKPNSVLTLGNGTAFVATCQCGYINKNVKIVLNAGSASMGYDLPAAIGACIGNNLKEVYCLTGDGSIQMNLQELQTIVTNNLKIKIIIINNDGYHSIRQTQNNYFNGNKVGIGPESNDLSFPEFKKLAKAFGLKYFAINNNDNLEDNIKKLINKKGPLICEIFVDKNQCFEPKPSSKKLPDGTMVSKPLEDLAPFLPRDEFLNNMFIETVDKNE